MAALRNNGTAELFVNLATHELREYFTLPRMVDHVLRRVEQPFIKKCLLMRVGAHLVRYSCHSGPFTNCVFYVSYTLCNTPSAL